MGRDDNRSVDQEYYLRYEEIRFRSWQRSGVGYWIPTNGCLFVVVPQPSGVKSDVPKVVCIDPEGSIPICKGSISVKTKKLEVHKMFERVHVNVQRSKTGVQLFLRFTCQKMLKKFLEI